MWYQMVGEIVSLLFHIHFIGVHTRVCQKLHFQKQVLGRIYCLTVVLYGSFQKQLVITSGRCLMVCRIRTL